MVTSQFAMNDYSKNQTHMIKTMVTMVNHGHHGFNHSYAAWLTMVDNEIPW